MIYQQTHLSQAENIGPLDRVNRIIVGTSIIMVAVLFTAITSAAAAGIVALGIYAGLTGFIGWDPLYALAKPLQQATPAQTPMAVTPLPHPGEQPSTDDYKKAA
jgi:hypothetical protein